MGFFLVLKIPKERVVCSWGSVWRRLSGGASIAGVNWWQPLGPSSASGGAWVCCSADQPRNSRGMPTGTLFLFSCPSHGSAVVPADWQGCTHFSGLCEESQAAVLASMAPMFSSVFYFIRSILTYNTLPHEATNSDPILWIIVCSVDCCGLLLIVMIWMSLILLDVGSILWKWFVWPVVSIWY